MYNLLNNERTSEATQSQHPVLRERWLQEIYSTYYVIIYACILFHYSDSQCLHLQI